MLEKEKKRKFRMLVKRKKTRCWKTPYRNPFK